MSSEQLRVECLAQGHFDTWSEEAKNETTDADLKDQAVHFEGTVAA